jgi:hypothetical protein
MTEGSNGILFGKLWYYGHYRVGGKVVEEGTELRDAEIDIIILKTEPVITITRSFQEVKQPLLLFTTR